jgi:hypothetical protein
MRYLSSDISASVPTFAVMSGSYTKRILDLMAVSHSDGSMPLYLHTVYRILRDMRIAQQETKISFSYAEFKRQVNDTPMTPA